MTAKQLEEINIRLKNLEKQCINDVMALVDIMSNMTFFGEIKKTSCEYAEEGQCSFFLLKKGAKNKLPIATDCRTKNCKDIPEHCHIEVSNFTCSLCPLWRNSQ